MDTAATTDPALVAPRTTPAPSARRRRWVAGLLGGLALTIGALGLAATPAHADVWAGSGYATTAVRCESGTLTLTIMITPIMGQTAWIKPEIWIYDATGGWRVAANLDWKQTVMFVSLPFTDLPHAYYYVRMNYAFGSAGSWEYRSEWITEYQSGAYQALSSCSV